MVWKWAIRSIHLIDQYGYSRAGPARWRYFLTMYMTSRVEAANCQCTLTENGNMTQGQEEPSTGLNSQTGRAGSINLRDITLKPEIQQRRPLIKWGSRMLRLSLKR